MIKKTLLVMFLLCALSTAIILIAPQTVQTSIKKGESTLLLPEGEYIYNITLYNATDTITVKVKKEKECTKIITAQFEMCGESGGTFIFQPWMKDVEKRKMWEEKVSFSYSIFSYESSLRRYEMKGKELFRGREAYVVEVKGIENDTLETLWIDKEFRFLLGAKGKGYSITLLTLPKE